MIKVVNDVEILLADERRNFENQVFILIYNGKKNFLRLILVNLLMVTVVGQNEADNEPTWIYVLKQVDYDDLSVKYYALHFLYLLDEFVNQKIFS